MRQAIWLSTSGLLLCSALAQTQPDVAGILRKVTQTYKPASEYELVADVADFKTGGNKGTTQHVLFAFKSPNQYRLEMSGLLDSEPIQVVLVHDGSTLWRFSPETNEYGSIPASELTKDAQDDQGDMAPAAQDTFMTWRYRGAANFTEGARFLREETIEIASAKVNCYVITFSAGMAGGRSVYTWWVDKQRFRVVREDNAGSSSSVFTTIKLDEPLPDDLFKFEPPPGARKVENQR